MDQHSPLKLRFADFRLDEADASLRRGTERIDLPPKAFGVLCVLARTPGQLVTKDALLDAVWGHRHVSESVLKTTISQLRTALADDIKNPRFVETAARRGYRFIGIPVASETHTSSPATIDTVTRTDSSAFVSTAIFGREAAFESLQERFAQAQMGRPQVVFVAGEAGIGKSTLVSAFRDRVTESAICVVGQCIESYGSAEPYMPVIDALNMIARGPSGNDLVTVMRQVAPTWLVQFPWHLSDEDRSRLARELAGSTQDRMLREFTEMLERFAGNRPLVLIFEDLHWSDHATVRLVDYLCRKRLGARLLVIGTFRPTDLIVTNHPMAQARRELRLHRLCTDIDLEMLSESQLSALAAHRLDGIEPPEDFLRELYRHTEGLPLFAINVLDELVSSQSLRRVAGAWVFPSAIASTVPANVVGAVELRLARVPDSTARILRTASVLGIEFSQLVLADVMQIDAVELQRTLDAEVANKQWLIGVGTEVMPDGRVSARYAFRHALYRHVIYGGLPVAERALCHQRVGDVLARVHADRADSIASELALHFERGGDMARAITQLTTVATRALATPAAQDALVAIQHALSLLPRLALAAQRTRAELELRIVEGLAQSQLHVIADPHVTQAFDRARDLAESLPPSRLTARALHGVWWGYFARARLREAKDIASKILAVAQESPEIDLRLAGNTTMGLTLMNLGEFTESKQYLIEALKCYASTQQEQLQVFFVQDPGVEAMGFLGLMSWWLGEPADARRYMGEAIALADRLGQPVSQVVALTLCSVLFHNTEEIEAATKVAARIAEIIRKYDLGSSYSWALEHAASASSGYGGSLEQLRAGVNRLRGPNMTAGLSGIQLSFAFTCYMAGQKAEAMSVVDDALEAIKTTDEHLVLSGHLTLKSMLLLDQGNANAARMLALQSIEVARRQGALFFELRALLASARIEGALSNDDRERIGLILRRFEAEDTPTLRQAKGLLDAVPTH
jgi:DNA-binding winged helix-turn-helix (wHTH) protein/tetratricopeptide (TPR) repeat protein